MKTYRLLVLLLVALFLLASCGDATETSSSAVSQAGDVMYSVAVKDALGNLFAPDMVVQFLQNGTRIAIQPCNEDGVAEKTLPAGEYVVTPVFTQNEDRYHYDQNVTVTAENPSAVLVVTEKPTELSILTVRENEYDAYTVGTGCTYLELTPGVRNYYLFCPAEAGNYEFSLLDGTTATIGYYGAPHYVQEFSAVEVTENTFTISVRASMISAGDGGTVVYVLGVDAPADVSSCIMLIRRIGDPVKTIEDEPWIIYESTVDIAPYTLPEGTKLTDFDLFSSTDAYTLVYNESDGFYHMDTADGPLVYIRLTKDSDYMDSYETILEHTGVNKYFFDENGNFVKKEAYGQCLLEYIACVDSATGVYPLTEDLRYIVTMHGEHQGWWDEDSALYLFVDMDGESIPGINIELAWLLMCCYES